MEKKLIVGNWKMNGDRALAQTLAHGAVAAAHAEAEVVLCPSYVHLGLVGDILQDTSVKLGAQALQVAVEKGGAQTGDISAVMLKDMGCSYVLCGHSERRAQYGETSEDIQAQALAALEVGLTPIICVGETAADRDAGREFEVVRADLLGSIPKDIDPARMLLAYEPVWAISAGDPNKPPAKLEDIIAMMSYMRKTLSESLANSATLRMLYGASVKPDNARAILAADHVDGVLVGGASLKADLFAGVIAAASNKVKI